MSLVLVAASLLLATALAVVYAAQQITARDIHFDAAINAIAKNDVFTTERLAAALGSIVAFVIAFKLAGQKRLPLVKSDLKPMLPASYPKPVSSTSLKDEKDKSVIVCYEPATLAHLGNIRLHTAEDVQRVVANAREAQKSWAQTTFDERRRVLSMMRTAILAQSEDIIRLSCLDTGKPAMDALFGEILSSAAKLQWVVEEGEKVLAPETRQTNFTSMHKVARLEYQPLGVVGVIAPWNYPFYNMYNHIASGLFAGNAVVIKISEYSSWSATHFIRIAQDVLKANNFSTDLCQLVCGFGETGAALVASTDKIIFTGSPGVGKAVMNGASKTLTPLVLELGGKDPFIVCEDANVQSAVTLALRGTYQNSGQNCVGIERIYVYESIYDEFVRLAVEGVKKIRVGSPVKADGVTFNQVDMGPITTAPQLTLIQDLVDDAVKKGARLLLGGKARFVDPSSNGKKTSSKDGNDDPLSKGLFYEPTVLADVTHDMRIANEEVFGPVMTIFKVDGNSDERVIALANSTEYGLGATVFSGSPARANAIAKALRCGMVGVNAYGLNYLVQSLPFGGVGASGFDRFAGPEGLRACCNMKSMVTDWSDKFSIPTPVPKPLQYPVAPSAVEFTKNLIVMQFGDTWWDKFKAMLGLAKA